MNRTQKAFQLEQCIHEMGLIRIARSCCTFDECIRPLAVGSKLVMGLFEDNFMYDGYQIYRLSDIEDILPLENKIQEILRSEGLMEPVETPQLDLEGWKECFTSLFRLGQNLAVQEEYGYEDLDEITIGRIIRVGSTYSDVWAFDPEGRWEDRPRRISYSNVTSVVLGGRYVSTFSKYIGPPPAVLEK